MTSEMPFTMNVAPAGNGNGYSGGMFGGEWFWAIIILAMFWGGNGWGNGFGGGNGAGVQGALTRGDLCMDMNFSDLESAVRNGVAESNANFRSVDNAVCSLGYQNAQLINGVQGAVASGFHGLDNAICNQSFQIERGIAGLGSQIASCCCETNRAIDGIKFQNAQDTCAVTTAIQSTTRDIIENQSANARAILDKLTAQEIAAKDAQIAAQTQQIFGLQLKASQEAQNAYLVNQLRPCPVPSYITCNPWASQAAYGSCGSYNSGCGCGCGCNG